MGDFVAELNSHHSPLREETTPFSEPDLPTGTTMDEGARAGQGGAVDAGGAL